jgi:hypothetical protein
MWARMSGRVRFGPQLQGDLGFWVRPFTAPGRWIAIGPVRVRLGSRSSWPGEDETAEMIKPVQP